MIWNPPWKHWKKWVPSKERCICFLLSFTLWFPHNIQHFFYLFRCKSYFAFFYELLKGYLRSVLFTATPFDRKYIKKTYQIQLDKRHWTGIDHGQLFCFGQFVATQCLQCASNLFGCLFVARERFQVPHCLMFALLSASLKEPREEIPQTLLYTNLGNRLLVVWSWDALIEMCAVPWGEHRLHNCLLFDLVLSFQREDE